MTSPPDNNQDSFRALAAAAQSLMQQLLGELPARSPEPAELVAALTADPANREKLASLQSRYYQDWLRLWSEPDVTPPAADPRFDASEWQQLPWFRMLRRVYEMNSEYLASLTELADLPAQSKARLRYLARQLVEAMAPTNFAATNPEAIRRAMESGGSSLAQGLEQLGSDLGRGRISMSDEQAFEVGRNLAVTPGDVVFENDLIQLIQYRPSTPEVHERPLLIVPPFINKYYILDLQPQNSFVRFCVDQGHTTFIVSWRNIPGSLGHLTWDDYIEKGVIAPIRVVREISGNLTINALGFCVGGTLLCTALAVLAARKRRPVHSLSLLATLLDFSDTGEISVYVDAGFVEHTESQYAQGGLVPGSRLATTFAMLRARDLVWHFVVNNYLLGRTPPAFDLLYWNADSANLPGPLYAYYLRNMYFENNLRVPGKLKLGGVAVNLGAIEMPTFVMGTREDHIVPWRSAYASAQLLGGRTEFVLGASGHVAGIVNPPAAKRRRFWTGPPPEKDADAWLASAQEHAGSWWTHWIRWLEVQGGGRRPAPSCTGSGRYPAIEPAPGRYVRARGDAAAMSH